MSLLEKKKALPLASHSVFYFILAGKKRKMIEMTSRVIKILNGQNAGPLSHHKTEPQSQFQIVLNYDVTYVNIQDVFGLFLFSFEMLQ